MELLIGKGMGELYGEMPTCYTLIWVVVMWVFSEGQTHWAVPSICVYSIVCGFHLKRQHVDPFIPLIM